MRSIGVGGGDLVDRGDGEDRLAGVERLVGQRASRAPFSIRQVVGGEDRLDARHRQRRAGVDAAHARVRHRAEEQLAEQHAVGAEVLGVLRAAGDLGDVVGRHVVGADQLLVSHYVVPPHVLGALHQRGEDLVVVLAAAQVAGDAVRQLARASGSG